MKSVPQGVSKFDAARLPDRPLLDTGVWLRALGWAHDPEKLCASFVGALELHEKRRLMAAPTLSELLRGDPKRVVPNGKGIVRVAFDGPAAERLGRVATAEWLGQFPDGIRRGIKYDALIAATGRQASASCLVSWDEDTFIRRICDALELRLHHPRDFLAKQTSMDLGNVSGGKSENAPARAAAPE